MTGESHDLISDVDLAVAFVGTQQRLPAVQDHSIVVVIGHEALIAVCFFLRCEGEYSRVWCRVLGLLAVALIFVC